MRSLPRPFAELRLQSVGYGSRADALVVGHYLECLSFFDFSPQWSDFAVMINAGIIYCCLSECLRPFKRFGYLFVSL